MRVSEPPHHVVERAQLTRRDLFRAAATGVLAVTTPSGCGSGGSDADQARVPRAADAADLTASGSDVALVTMAISDEERLLRECSRAAAAHSSLRSLLVPLATRQQIHVMVLRNTLTVPGPAVRTTSQRSARSAGDAVRDLLGAAARTEQRRRRDCLAASSGPLAGLLASMAASHAVTVHHLRSGP